MKKPWRIGIALAAIAVLAGLGLALWRFVLSPVSLHTAFEARCDGATIRIVEERHEKIASDAAGWSRVYGEWNGERRFAIDLEAMPRHLTWSRPRSTVHGEGPRYVHFFVGRTAAADRIERCVESHADEIVEEVLRTDFAATPGERGRVYWRAASATDLEPTFSDGTRTLLLERDGTIVERGAVFGAPIGRAEVGAEGRATLRCCAGMDAAAIERFVDADGRSLVDRLGVPPP